jgi:putative nucleotidyltransferase with HDIG domain
LFQTLQDEPRAQVLVPTFTRITGHPPLIRSELIQDIIAYQGSQGLRGVLDQAGQIQVPVPDKHILLDLDTPEQYQKALELRQTYDLPDPDEAYALLVRQQGDDRAVIRHSCKVAQTAERIAKEMNHFSGAGLNIGLVKSAALLHDIAKGHTDHARAGGNLLMELGFSSRLAEIVAKHADYSPSARAPVNETEVVYLADKLVQEDRLIGLDQRFAHKYERFFGNPEARQAVKRRWEQAGYVLARVEQGLGRNLKKWLQL